MSQKKLKKLRKTEIEVVNKEVSSPVLGIRQIIKKYWKFLLILVLGTVALYFNSLKGDFVSDDYATIPQNPEIMSFKHGLSGWIGGLINWFLAINFGIKSPIPYHVTSLLIYLVIVVLVFVFIKVIIENELVAKITAIIFAVLPIHVESVSWIAGRPYLLNGLFVILSLILLALYSKTENKKYFWLFFVSAFLTFSAEKTRSTALFLLGILYWVSFDHKLKKKVDMGKVLLIFAGLFLLVIIVLWPQMIHRIESVNSGINDSGSIFYNPFFQYPTSIAKYLQLMIFPVDLTLYHTMFVIPVWMNWIILLTYLAAVVWFWTKDKKIFFALAFMFVAAAPSMAPVKISWLVAERYMFLGSLGMCLLLALLIEKFFNKHVKLMILFLILLVGVYAVRVFFRNIDWQTNHNLWVNTCQVSPNSHNAWNNIGDDYDKLGQYDNAIKGFAQSFAIKPNYADAYHNQANILYKVGRLDLAREAYEIALYYNPYLYQTYLTLIQIDLMQNNQEKLLDHLSKLQAIKPNDLQVSFVTATAYAQIGRIEEAKQIAKSMYQQFPNITEIKNLYDSLMNTPSKN